MALQALSTSVLEALPVKLDIKRHSPSPQTHVQVEILCTNCICDDTLHCEVFHVKVGEDGINVFI